MIRIRFLTLLALLPFFVALCAQATSSDFAKRRVQHVAVRSNKVADIAWLQANKMKVERRYGNYDEAMQKRHEEIERRWVMYDANIKPDQSFVAEEDNIFSNLANGAMNIIGGGIKALTGGDAESQPAQAGPATKQATGSEQADSSADSEASDATGSKVTNIPLRTETNPNGQEREVLADITVGSQKFVVDPDSGSADFWILSDLCKSNCGDSGTKYKTSSSSAVDANKNFNIQYGAGSTSGKLYRDTAKLGDLTVRNLTIGAASHISSELASDPAGGILGLGFRQITSAGQKTFLDRLFTQEKLKSQVVSFAFGRSAKKTLSKAEMRFGDVNSQLYSGDISYSPVTTKGYWQFGVQSFAAGSGSGINLDSIVDTGTSLIAVEESQAAKFWKDVPNSKFDQEQGYYTYPCSQKINAVLKTKDGKSWPIEEDDFNLGSLTATSDRCVGAVFPAQTRNVVVLGIVFLKNAYSVLDYSQNRVGLAKYSF